MHKVFDVLDQMVNQGVLLDYAVGGGSAVLFYTEPFTTDDIDLFVFVPEARASSFLPLEDVYDFARNNNLPIEDIYVIVHGFKVQFLPAYNELIVETIEKAVDQKVGMRTVKVAAPEYLAAILTQTGRAKDKLKLNLLLDQAKLDRKRLSKILVKYKLKAKFDALQG
jgi:hypothetical protein